MAQGAHPDPRDPGRLISRALWQAENAVDRALDRALAPLGLSTALHGALAYLAQEPGMSAAELARRAKVRPQSAAHAVARLEGMGMVERAPHPVHGRVMRISPTEAGRRALDDATGVLARAERELVRDLAADDVGRLFEGLEALRSGAERLSGPQKRGG